MEMIEGNPGGGNGGSDGGSVLTGGGKASGSGGGQSGAGGNPGGNNNGGGQAGSQGGKTFSLPENWRDTLPDDIKSEPSLTAFKDFEGLLRGYLGAKKMVGADKIAVPGKHASEDDWREVYTKLGLPQDIKEYNLEAPKDVKLNDTFMSDFKALAHKNGVLPKQAQALLGFYAEKSKTASADFQKSVKLAQEKSLGALKQEWGEAYSKKLGQAEFALRKFADPDTIKFIEQTGLGNDAKIIKLFAKVAESFGEDTIHTEGGDGSDGAMTPEQATKEVNKVMGDPNHPYWIKEHPGHQAAVDEMKRLNQYRWPGSKDTPIAI